MKQKELDALLRTWQKVLRMQDWSVDIVIATVTLSTGPLAALHPDPTHRKATIYIPEAVDDPERRIVHELVHIPLLYWSTNLERDTVEWCEMEMAVNLFADALLNLKRKASR